MEEPAREYSASLLSPLVRCDLLFLVKPHLGLSQRESDGCLAGCLLSLEEPLFLWNTFLSHLGSTEKNKQLSSF